MIVSSVEKFFGPISNVDPSLLPIVEGNFTKLARRLCDRTDNVVYNGNLLPLIHARPKCALKMLKSNILIFYYLYSVNFVSKNPISAFHVDGMIGLVFFLLLLIRLRN